MTQIFTDSITARHYFVPNRVPEFEAATFSSQSIGLP